VPLPRVRQAGPTSAAGATSASPASRPHVRSGCHFRESGKPAPRPQRCHNHLSSKLPRHFMTGRRTRRPEGPCSGSRFASANPASRSDICSAGCPLRQARQAGPASASGFGFHRGNQQADHRRVPGVADRSHLQADRPHDAPGCQSAPPSRRSNRSRPSSVHS